MARQHPRCRIRIAAPEIRRLRNMAEAELGDRFDIRDSHDRIVENGSMTLPMTEKVVLAWIEKTKQG